MSTPTHGGHPPADLLADLAAEVLPVAEARAVEAHVMACPACEQVLVDAERMRALLSAPDPGPMPTDVWARIEGALSAEAAGRAGQSAGRPAGWTGSWFDPPPPTTDLPVAAPGASQPTVPLPASPQSYVDEAPTAAFQAFVDEPGAVPLAGRRDRNRSQRPPARGEEPAASGPAPGTPAEDDEDPARTGPTRPIRSLSATRSRRDVRDESGRRRFSTPLLAAAAAAVVGVLGFGGWGVTSMMGGHDGQGAASILQTGRGIVHTSGAAYTPATLGQQVTALIRTGSPVASPSASGSATASAKASPSASIRTDGTVADPKRLEACLVAVGAGGQRVLAVDLGTYQGKEVAVVVLASDTGSGYDVWVVARTCAPGAEGTVGFVKVPV